MDRDSCHTTPSYIQEYIVLNLPIPIEGMGLVNFQLNLEKGECFDMLSRIITCKYGITQDKLFDTYDKVFMDVVITAVSKS